jgi:hypothetical protein
MLAATILAVFFVPVFFVLMQGLGDLRRRRPAPSPAVTSDSGPIAEAPRVEIAPGAGEVRPDGGNGLGPHADRPLAPRL